MNLVSIPLILVLFLFTAQALCAADDIQLQQQFEQAIKDKDLDLAESLCKKRLELLPEDSLERGSALMQHGAILNKFRRYNEGNEEKQQAIQIIYSYTEKNKNLTDQELDLRAAALRIYQEDMDGPCTFMSDLERRIKRLWFPHCCHGQSSRVVVLFRIHKNGRLSNLRISRSSGCADSDQAGLNAVKNASPFYPLPLYAPSSVEIEFNFDYNLFSNKTTPSSRVIKPTSMILVPTCD